MFVCVCVFLGIRTKMTNTNFSFPAVFTKAMCAPFSLSPWNFCNLWIIAVNWFLINENKLFDMG